MPQMPEFLPWPNMVILLSHDYPHLLVEPAKIIFAHLLANPCFSLQEFASHMSIFFKEGEGNAENSWEKFEGKNLM